MNHTPAEPAELPKLQSNQKGIWGEHIAAAWLLRCGYEVFQGLGNTSVDFIALRDGKSLRVEVKAASVKTHGKPSISTVDWSKFDLLLVVLPDGDVLVDPSSDQITGAQGSLYCVHRRTNCEECRTARVDVDDGPLDDVGFVTTLPGRYRHLPMVSNLRRTRCDGTTRIAGEWTRRGEMTQSQIDSLPPCLTCARKAARLAVGSFPSQGDTASDGDNTTTDGE